MIKNTYETHPDNVLSAYKDNAAVMKGSTAGRFSQSTRRIQLSSENIEILMKVETHNQQRLPHFRCIDWFGGEIAIGATGRGSKPKAGLLVLPFQICVSRVMNNWKPTTASRSHC